MRLGTISVANEPLQDHQRPSVKLESHLHGASGLRLLDGSKKAAFGQGRTVDEGRQLLLGRNCLASSLPFGRAFRLSNIAYQI